jgi:hypothetical protein
MLEKQLVEFELENGGKFLVEIEESEDTSLATERAALPSGRETQCTRIYRLYVN